MGNRPFRKVTFHAMNCSAIAARGDYNDLIILARCQSFRIVWISVAATLRLLGLGTACRPELFNLGVKWLFQYF